MALPWLASPIEARANTVPSPATATEFHNACDDSGQPKGWVTALNERASASPTATYMSKYDSPRPLRSPKSPCQEAMVSPVASWRRYGAAELQVLSAALAKIMSRRSLPAATHELQFSSSGVRTVVARKPENPGQPLSSTITTISPFSVSIAEGIPSREPAR